MAELLERDGTWTFDGDTVRIVPGTDRGVHRLRQALGEVAVPLAAIAGIAYEPGRKGGRLRLRLRHGADPLLLATGGSMPDEADPYQVGVSADRTGVAEYFADEVRNALTLEQVPDGPVDRFLLPGPPVPITATATDGSATFNGEQVRVEWNWVAQENKKHAGPRSFTLAELDSVLWEPTVGFNDGCLRFVPKGPVVRLKPDQDPNCLLLWGFKKETGMTALLAAAVTARLPHPVGRAAATALPPAALPAPAAPAALPAAAASEDPDVLLRHLRELGELHQSGILTAEEFATAKQGLLRRFG